MSRFSDLTSWLDWMETLHGQEIDLGLERVYQVAFRLGLIEITPGSQTFSGRFSLPGAHVITVAGTNGKGSCCAAITACLRASGLHVGTFTSPHFEHYCERICVDNQPVAGSLVCSAFTAIDNARGDISLTYFEFGTLAALWVFRELQLPYVVLEVGLGGRLDAVNIVDADIAVLTSVDIDHQDWLGDDRNVISREKLGISREGKPLVIAERDLTPHLEQAAARPGSRLIDRDFSLYQQDGGWQLVIGECNHALENVPLHPDSVAAALMAVDQLGVLPTGESLQQTVSNLVLTGRFQQRTLQPKPGKNVHLLLDVAHNPAAAESLACRLTGKGKVFAVFALMADKDLQGIIQPLFGKIDGWYLGDLDGIGRALPAKSLKASLDQHGQRAVLSNDIPSALKNALKDANEHDRIVIFGSFFTVAAANRWLGEHYPD